MKGQASYQLLVVSPEVRKSKELKERDGEMGVRKGKKKKTKLLLANCHMHYTTVFKYTASQGPGEPSKIWGLAKKFQLGSLHTPRERRAWDPVLSGGQDVVKLCREQQQFRITWELRVRCCEPVARKKVGAEKAGGGREKL